MELTPAKLAGRCCTGEERGQGVRIHAIPGAYRQSIGNEVFGTALCKAKPGRRSVGWTAMDGYAVTCPKCLRKMSSNVRANRETPHDDA